MFWAENFDLTQDCSYEGEFVNCTNKRLYFTWLFNSVVDNSRIARPYDLKVASPLYQNKLDKAELAETILSA